MEQRLAKYKNNNNNNNNNITKTTTTTTSAKRHIEVFLNGFTRGW